MWNQIELIGGHLPNIKRGYRTGGVSLFFFFGVAVAAMTVGTAE
jgi:hypothetical protein